MIFTRTLYSACVHLISLKIVSKIKFNRAINSHFEKKKKKKKKKKGIYRVEFIQTRWRFCARGVVFLLSNRFFANILLISSREGGDLISRRERNERENIRAKRMVAWYERGLARHVGRNRNEHTFSRTSEKESLPFWTNSTRLGFSNSFAA